eukprot:6114237-Prymnesium_polylepis.1
MPPVSSHTAHDAGQGCRRAVQPSALALLCGSLHCRGTPPSVDRATTPGLCNPVPVHSIHRTAARATGATQTRQAPCMAHFLARRSTRRSPSV